MTALHVRSVALLCEFAEASPPFPLQVPSSGTTDVERAVNFRGARVALDIAGLADDRGPRGVAAEFVSLLNHRLGTLDLVLHREPEHVLNAVLLFSASKALLLVQTTFGVGGAQFVRATSHSPDAGTAAFLALLPKVPPSVAGPFSVSRRHLDRMRSVVDSREEAGELFAPGEVESACREAGITDGITRRLVTELGQTHTRGQVGATVPRKPYGEDLEDVRHGTELSWLDTPRGRYGLHVDAEWVSVNPLRESTIAAAVRRSFSSISAGRA